MVCDCQNAANNFRPTDTLSHSPPEWSCDPNCSSLKSSAQPRKHCLATLEAELNCCVIAPALHPPAALEYNLQLLRTFVFFFWLTQNIIRSLKTNNLWPPLYEACEVYVHTSKPAGILILVPFWEHVLEPVDFFPPVAGQQCFVSAVMMRNRVTGSKGEVCLPVDDDRV